MGETGELYRSASLTLPNPFWTQIKTDDLDRNEEGIARIIKSLCLIWGYLRPSVSHFIS
jgi:hypothetical protein